MGIRRITPLGYNPVFKKKVYPQNNHRSRTKECKDVKNDPERNDRVNYMITCKKREKQYSPKSVHWKKYGILREKIIKF